ncbi:hypothetical protein FACS189459_6250 [Bacilli bacterium]|nr:hypothetical protein FACS189459_6250 [Bacilli bacterium]
MVAITPIDVDAPFPPQYFFANFLSNLCVSKKTIQIIGKQCPNIANIPQKYTIQYDDIMLSRLQSLIQLLMEYLNITQQIITDKYPFDASQKKTKKPASFPLALNIFVAPGFLESKFLILCLKNLVKISANKIFPNK